MLDAIERLERHADDGETPDDAEQGPAPRTAQRAEHERRVGARDQQEDRPVVELAQQRLRAPVRDRVVHRGRAVEQHHRYGEDGGADDVHRPAGLQRGHDENRRRGDRRNEPEPVAQAVRDLLAPRLRSFRHGRTTPSGIARAGRVAARRGNFDGSLPPPKQRACLILITGGGCPRRRLHRTDRQERVPCRRPQVVEAMAGIPCAAHDERTRNAATDAARGQRRVASKGWRTRLARRTMNRRAATGRAR